MTLVLDSSIVMSLEKGNLTIKKKLKELSEKYEGSPVITFVTYFEFLVGIKGRSKENQEKALGFINSMGVLKVRKETAEVLANLKHSYDKKGSTLPLADFLIASQVIEHNMLLVTSDKDFDKIKELKKIII